MDYEPLDLGAYVNSYDELKFKDPEPWRGRVILHGLPFVFAEERGRSRIVRVTPDQPISIPVVTPVACSTLTFAHRVNDARGPGLAPVGRDNGFYIFTFSDGRTIQAGIRNGFEIAPPWLGDLRDYGVAASLAVPDRENSLPDRYQGAFADTGVRQSEVVYAGAWSSSYRAGTIDYAGWRFYLWSWINPRAGVGVVRIDLVALEGVLEIGGICIGFVDEHPLRPEPARVVVAEVPAGYLGDVAELAIDVDRGTVGYTTVLAQTPADDDPLSSWGDDPDAGLGSVYARVSALPSSTVRLVASGQSLADARWGDLRRQGSTGSGPVRVTECGRNWVRTKIVDDATGETMPCRVHFSSPEGVPYQPYGHHQHVNSDLPSWHVDVGSDVRLGRTTYAYVDGSCEGWLPRGPVRVQVARGFEYQSLDDFVSIGDETQELTLRLKRTYDPSEEGWYSGDTHVHFISSFGGLREAAAEGVSVVHLLLSQWGSLFTNTEDFVGHTLASRDGKTLLHASQENRQHFLGHLSLLGLRESVMPWCTAGPPEAEMGGGLEATLSDWADQCHTQGGTVIVPHFSVPNGETATLISTGRVDALEIYPFGFQERAFIEYYRYLNAGFRLPVAGGTDKMSNSIPIGLSRTYVRIDDAQDLSLESWCDGLKAGRSYMSTGPLLDLEVDGIGVGGTVHLPGGGGTVAVRATAKSIFPMFRMELVYRGIVVANSDSGTGAHELSISEELRIDRQGWICVRVGGGPERLARHRDHGRMVIVAHSSPIYIVCGGLQYTGDRDALEYTMGMVERGRSYVKDFAPTDIGPDVLHHHGRNHAEFLLKPFDEARAALEQMLRAAHHPQQG